LGKIDGEVLEHELEMGESSLGNKSISKYRSCYYYVIIGNVAWNEVGTRVLKTGTIVVRECNFRLVEEMGMNQEWLQRLELKLSN